MGKKRNNNMYDSMIIVLIISIVTGYVGPFYVHPVTLLTIAFSPFLLNNISFFSQAKRRGILWILVFLFIYSAISLMWTPQPKRSLMSLFRMLMHIIMCLELIVFAHKANNPLHSIAFGWFVAFSLTSVVAIWEMITDNHIMVISNEDLDFGFERQRAAVTFYNINTYSLFVVFSLPFILCLLLTENKGLFRTIQVGVLLLLITIVFLNVSRGAILTMLTMLALFFYYMVVRGGRKMKILSFLLALFFIVFMLLMWDVLTEAIIYRTSDQGIFHDRYRIELIRSSWELFLNSYGFGQGFGSMIPSLARYAGNDTTLTYSHNLLLELLLEGGIVYGLSFIAYLFKVARSAIRYKNPIIKSLLMSVIVSFPFYSVINSSYIAPTFVWLFFVSVYIFTIIPDGYYGGNKR